VYLGEIFVRNDARYADLPKTSADGNSEEGLVNMPGVSYIYDRSWIHEAVSHTRDYKKLARFARLLNHKAECARCPVRLVLQGTQFGATLARPGFVPVYLSISISVIGSGAGTCEKAFLFLEDFKKVLSTLSRMRDFDASAFSFSH
jgi:hypothetical protein